MTDFAIPPDEQDKALGATGDDSIYQRVRLLTPQQRDVVDGILSGLSPHEACLRAGFKTSAPMQSIRAKMPDIMRRAGLTDEFLVGKLKTLVDARETKFFASKGIVCDERDVDALEIQTRALDMSFKLTGAYDDADKDDDSNITVNIVSIGGKQ